MKTRFKSQRAARAAFSLLEILTVVSILAVLLALALPVSGTITRKTKVTKDLANLRQIGIVTSLYVAEWGSYPGAGFVRFGRVRDETVNAPGFDYSPLKDSVHVAEKLFPYMANNKTFYRSPLFSEQDDAEKTTNYRHNINVYGYLKENRSPARAALTTGQTIVWMVSGYDNLADGGASLVTIPFENKRNYLYTDGHTERLKVAQNNWDPSPMR